MEGACCAADLGDAGCGDSMGLGVVREVLCVRVLVWVDGVVLSPDDVWGSLDEMLSARTRRSNIETDLAG